MNQSTEVEPVEVDRRALEIRALHGLIIDALRRSVRDAIKIGLLLETQKAELPHGSFRLWVEEQLPFTERTARRYMALHRHRELIAEQPDLQSA